MEHTKRIYFLDTLRTFVITLVVFYHVNMHYVNLFQDMPFVKNMVPDAFSSIILFLILAVNGQLMNAIMFFIAGYFALGPLIKKGATPFLKDKIVRLGIPYLVGLILLSPIASYIAARSWGNDEGFFKYWIFEFYKSQNISQFHLWFIGVLLLFFILLSLVYVICSVRVKSAGITKGQLTFRSIVLFIAVTTGFYFVVNQFINEASFTNLYIINFQGVMLLVYAAYFLLGIHAYQKDWFKTGYRPRIIPWFVTYVISIIIYIAFVVYESTVPDIANFSVVNLLLVLSFNISIFSAVFVLLALFQRFADKSTPFTKRISISRYSIYIFHYVVVYALIYATNHISLPVFAEYGLVLALSILLSWGLGYLMSNVRYYK
ncbi:acyltransferase family protein [Aquibacillus rhizosphaerae]|uniref:Acyltransferase family protein n=1 Tax=Aquibacillus rhizosphaerae TaxID=3051431 RepID=A0ABT7L233_9BACI|nr:acyltransferase family protein [Aquibacillus sp. LR5S19]MDL4839894.1 acyltransferase family protein [Aquibacillus sp. LR5S19]